MGTGNDLLLEFALPRFAYVDDARRGLRSGRTSAAVEITLSPGGDDVRHIGSIARRLTR